MEAKTVLILFATKRGTTETAAKVIASVLEGEGWQVTLQAAAGKKPADLAGFALVVLGSSTWGDGDLHQDMWDLEKLLSDVDLTGRTMAAFGLGNSRYPSFGWAADILANRLKNQGARQPVKALKLDTLAGLDENALAAWAASLADRA